MNKKILTNNILMTLPVTTLNIGFTLSLGIYKKDLSNLIKILI